MAQPFTLADEFKDPSLETSLLASIALRPELYWELVGRLRAEVFTEGRDETYRTLVAAIEAEEPVPTVDGTLADDPHAAASRLGDLYQRRRLADATHALLSGLRSGKASTDLITDFGKELALVETAFKEAEAGQMTTIDTVFPEVLAEIRTVYEHRLETGSTVLGIGMGLERLDRELGGLQPGLHILAAEPGTGKTTFTLQIASQAAGKGHPVVFLSFEETIKRLTLKVVCAKAGLVSKSFSEGAADPERLEAAYRQHGASLKLLHFIGGGQDTTVAQLKAKTLQAMARAKGEKPLIIVDYLQRWASTRKSFSDFRHVVGQLVGELRDVALKLECPVLVISSQNRGGQGGDRMTSLKESGDLEYGGDSISFLVSNDARFVSPPSRAIDFVLRKNRFGDKDQKIPLIFRADVGTFEEGSEGSHV